MPILFLENIQGTSTGSYAPIPQNAEAVSSAPVTPAPKSPLPSAPVPSQVITYAEVALSYGGTFSLTDTFDLALVVDAYGSPAATQQWLDLMLATCPRLYDENGIPCRRGDDICNQDFGGGLRAMVGATLTEDLKSERIAAISKQLADNPQIASSPTPSVAVTDLGGGMVQTEVSCQTVTGQTVTANKITNIFGG